MENLHQAHWPGLKHQSAFGKPVLTSAEPPRCKSDKSASRRLSQTDGDSAADARLDSCPVSTPALCRLLLRLDSLPSRLLLLLQPVSTPSRLDSCSVSTPAPSRLPPRLNSRPSRPPPLARRRGVCLLWPAAGRDEISPAGNGGAGGGTARSAHAAGYSASYGADRAGTAPDGRDSPPARLPPGDS